MTSPTGNLLGRLRRALSPKLEVESELGAGGMGVVFLGRDTVLDRAVAIKVLRPEAATAAAAERFLREGRLLARLDHPHVVAVHQAGQADGLFYLVMDRLEGERLSDRLRSGPLLIPDVLRLALELLDAVSAIHRAGVVHRDIKPDNVLFKGDRAILTDFGIATETVSHTGDLTLPGVVIGTPGYMAPEQAMGEPASPQSDIWAVGVTLCEAATGQRYTRQGLESAGLPSQLSNALGRALEIEPDRRWPSAAAFRAALAGERPRRRIVAALGIATAGLALAATVFWSRQATGTPSLRQLVLAPIGAGGRVPAPVRDSIEHALTSRLAGYPDFEVVSARRGGNDALRLQGVLSAQGTGLRFDFSLQQGRRVLATLAPAVPLAADWPALVDSVGDEVARVVLTGSLAGDPWLPSFAVPRAAGPLRLFLDGERAFASGQWEVALRAYLEAERVDTACLLCSYRLADVARWMNWPQDRARTARLRTTAERFPPHYRIMIEADALPIAQRLEMLETAVQTYRDFDVVWYRLAEELFHRGPLAGRLRAESGEAFRASLRVRPGFAPAWYHLAGLAIAEGDSSNAAQALAQYERLEGELSGLPFAQLALLLAAQSWRFGGGAMGPNVTSALIADPRLPSNLFVTVGPRLLLSFQAWNGALWLGRELERRGDPAELVRAGLIAQTLAHLARGRPDSAERVAARLELAVSDHESRVFAAGLPALLALAERDSLAVEEVTPLAARLRQFLDPRAKGPAARRAAALLLGALGIASNQAPLQAEADHGLGTDRLATQYRAILAALAGARAGIAAPDPDSLLEAEPALLAEQPAVRALTRFWTARMLARQSRPASAIRVLRWVEHQDIIGLPSGPPLASELDWALGPLAHAQEADLLDRNNLDRPRLCHLLGELAEGWRTGAPAFAERARLAGERHAVLRCGAAS